MKKLIALLLLLVLANISFGQTEEVSECLKLIKLTESTYIHSCNNNNGMVYFSNNEAIIVSTPDSDIETQKLINWVKERANIVAYVIDRWHPDAMQGLDVANENNIDTYSNKRTELLAKRKGLPLAKLTFKTKKSIRIGNERVVCHFLGEAHTTDGIVVWIPSEKVLFGGNGIRNLGGWIGNIADANLSEWSKTAQKVKDHYGDAKIIIPGHGKYGGVELVDYTIKLYNFSKQNDCVNPFNLEAINKESLDGFDFVFKDREPSPSSVIYLHSRVRFEKSGKQFEINADSIIYTSSERTITVPKGCIISKENSRIESFSFNQLYASFRDDEVELTVVIKEINP